MIITMVVGFSIQHINAFEPEIFLFGRLPVPYIMNSAV